MRGSMQYGKIRLRSRVSSALKACLVYALILVAVGLAQPANAASGSTESDAKPAAEPSVKDQIMEVWNRDVFLGDWRGLRTQLHDRGIDIGLRLSQYGQGVASGGVNQNAEYGGRMDYRVNTDLRKLFGLWEGSSISMHAMSRFGRDIGADAGAFALPNAELLVPLPDDYNGSRLLLDFRVLCVIVVRKSQLIPKAVGK